MRTIFFVALLFLTTSKTFAQSSADINETDFSTLSSQDIKLTIQIERPSPTDLCQNEKSWRWGAEQSCPNRKIASVKLSFRGQAVFVPYSAFADLGNPTTIGLQRNGKSLRYAITVRGGDAATSYECVLRFKGGVLQERHVKSAEFPDDSWEKTTYRFNYGAG